MLPKNMLGRDEVNLNSAFRELNVKRADMKKGYSVEHSRLPKQK